MAKTVGKKLGALFGAMMAAGTATKANAHDADHDFDVHKAASGTPDAAQTFDSGIQELDVSQLEPLSGATIERFEDIVNSFEREGGHNIYLFSPQSILERLPNVGYKRADQFGRSDYVALDTDKIAQSVLPSLNEYKSFNFGYNNEDLANYVAKSLGEAVGEGVFSAQALPLRGFKDKKTDQVCFAQLDEGQTKAEIVSQFAGREHVDVSFMTTEEAYGWIIGHELEHCRSSIERDDYTGEIHPGEGLGDSFAYAMNVQKNGINPDMIKGIKAMRTLNLYDSAKYVYEYNESIAGEVNEMGERLPVKSPHSGHYTVPIINKAMPQIEEAYAAGELQRMTPYEVSQAVMTWSFGPENERAENIQNMIEHQKQLGNIAVSVYAFQKAGLVDQMSPAQKDFYQEVQDARAFIERDGVEIDNLPYDEKRATYETELRETMDLQDTAVEKLSVLTAKQQEFEGYLDTLTDWSASSEEALRAERELFSRDGTGLTGHQRWNIVKDVRLEIERQHAHELPEQAPEKESAPTRTAEIDLDR